MTFLFVLSLALLVAAGIYTVMARSLISGAIALGMTSMVLSIVMFFLASPLAAVFELSVCAGLITVVFVSAIALTTPMSRTEMLEATRHRSARYWPLPVLLVVLSLVAVAFGLPQAPSVARAATSDLVGQVLWSQRGLEILGQMVLLLTGVLGVVVLFKQGGKNA